MVLWARVVFHCCEDIAELVGRQNLKEAMCIQKLSRPGGGGCEAVLALVRYSAVQVEWTLKKNEKKWKEKKNTKGYRNGSCSRLRIWHQCKGPRILVCFFLYQHHNWICAQVCAAAQVYAAARTVIDPHSRLTD